MRTVFIKYRGTGTRYECDKEVHVLAKYRNGKTFEGAMVNNRITGAGRLMFADGYRLTCSWIDGKPNGKGTLTHDHGSSYTGDWVEGVCHGQCECVMVKGDLMATYCGEVQNNKRHGKGTMTSNNGIVITGFWQNNVLHGFAEFRNKIKGTVYKGNWRNNMKHGEGVLTKESGETIVGSWVNGKLSLPSERTMPNGVVMTANIVGGMLNWFVDYDASNMNPPDDIICPLTLCAMHDPVIAYDGHTYERCALEAYFATVKKDVVASPMTRETIGKGYISNLNMRKRIGELAMSACNTSGSTEKLRVKKQRTL